MGSSENPIRLSNFVCSTYINSPYWIGLSQLWCLVFSETLWPLCRRSTQQLVRFWIVKCFSLPYGAQIGRPPEHPANDFTQGGNFGWQSSLYARASQIDRPLSRSYFKEQSGRLLPSFHTARYRSVCRIYLLGWNGQIAKTGLSPARLNILLAAPPLRPAPHP